LAPEKDCGGSGLRRRHWSTGKEAGPPETINCQKLDPDLLLSKLNLFQSKMEKEKVKSWSVSASGGLVT